LRVGGGNILFILLPSIKYRTPINVCKERERGGRDVV
jgi:hypothetical protein